MSDDLFDGIEIDEERILPDPANPAPERGVDPKFDAVADPAWTVVRDDEAGTTLTEREFRDTIWASLAKYADRPNRYGPKR